MPDLIAKLPITTPAVTCGDTTLSAADWVDVLSVAPMPGQEKAVAKALKPLGLTFPAPNTWNAKGAARIVWTGREQAFLMGSGLANLDGAATTDQSDGWVSLRLSGAQAIAALARLVSLDLRAMGQGDAARTALNHMPLILICEGPGDFTLMTFRSMAQSAWHEIHDAMLKVEARATLHG